MLGVIELIEDLSGCRIRLDRRPAQAGDVFHTSGATELARDLLGWKARTSLEVGLKHQVAWHLERR